MLRGFGVRVTGAGTKSFVFQYRLGGRESRTRRYTIGRHGSPWNAADARAEAERLAQMVARKEDPMTIELRRRRQAKRAELGEYVDKFSQLYLEKRWKRSDRAKSLLERHAVPMLRHLPIHNIDRQDIARIYDRLANTPSVAHQLHATLRKLFRWAVSRGDLYRSPLECVEGPRRFALVSATWWMRNWLSSGGHAALLGLHLPPWSGCLSSPVAHLHAGSCTSLFNSFMFLRTVGKASR